MGYVLILFAIVFWEIIKVCFLPGAGAIALVSLITYLSGGNFRKAAAWSTGLALVAAAFTTMYAIEHGFR